MTAPPGTVFYGRTPGGDVFVGRVVSRVTTVRAKGKETQRHATVTTIPTKDGSGISRPDLEALQDVDRMKVFFDREAFKADFLAEATKRIDALLDTQLKKLPPEEIEADPDETGDEVR